MSKTKSQIILTQLENGDVVTETEYPQIQIVSTVGAASVAGKNKNKLIFIGEGGDISYSYNVF